MPIDFVGVWDTVAAVGMPPFGLKTWHLLPDYLGANLRFQAWQFLLAPGSDGSVSGWLSTWRQDLVKISAAPLQAVLLDLLFIAAYAVAGATGVVPAMARRSGLRRIGDPVSAWPAWPVCWPLSGWG